MNYSVEFIEYIKEKYGLPCYVFDEEEFLDNYIKLKNALTAKYSRYEIAYSYKTNYAPKICQLVKNLGGYAEVVSDMEYDIAKAVGYDSARIIYNGPFKGPRLEEHIMAGGILNVDNLEEINRVIRFSEEKQLKVKVGIRCNIRIGQHFISRFGIDSESNDFSEAVQKLNNSKYTKLIGLHCHVGQSRSLEAWKARTVRMLELADQFIDGVPEYLDLGSGMFGNMHPDMLNQFNVSIPSYEDYAEVTAAIVDCHYKFIPEEKKPILFTEPGTTVDNRYIDLIAEVDSIKQIQGKDIAVLNCSIHNLGDIIGSIKLPLQVVHNSNKMKPYFDMDFTGYTCLERDLPYRGYSGSIAKGDYVVFGNVGGYSNVNKPPFILPQCAMIGINKSEEYLIKRKETTQDILSTYIY